MSGGLMGTTGSIVEYALDGLSQRHMAIAANIANIDSAGYRPIRVSFESHIAAYLNRTTGRTSTETSLQLPSPQISSEPPVTNALRRASMENEIVQLNRNVLQYQALIGGLGKYASIIYTAINEGRR